MGLPDRLRTLDRAVLGSAAHSPAAARPAGRLRRALVALLPWAVVAAAYLAALPLVPGSVDRRAVAVSLALLAGAALVATAAPWLWPDRHTSEAGIRTPRPNEATDASPPHGGSL